jgi:tRNA/rRNA methyltransferase
MMRAVTHPSPRYEVCLVRTGNPENLGSVARIMDNFGFSRLTLVAPSLAALEPKALVVACRARDRLEQARVVGTLEEAVAGATLVVGTTARRGHRRPAIAPREIVARLSALASDDCVALVFGPEDRGLSTEEVDRCDLLCSIPTRGPLASLNLAQAVAIVLWEISEAGARPARPKRGVAPRAEIEGLLDHACEVLETIGYFRTRPRARARADLRRMLGAAGLRAEGVRALRGICRQALWALGKKSPE